MLGSDQVAAAARMPGGFDYFEFKDRLLSDVGEVGASVRLLAVSFDGEGTYRYRVRCETWDGAAGFSIKVRDGRVKAVEVETVEQGSTVCERCGRVCDPSDMRDVSADPARPWKVEAWCPSCLRIHAFPCEEHGRFESRETFGCVWVGGRGYLCDDAFEWEEDAVQCAECGLWYLKDLTEEVEDLRMCRECADDHYDRMWRNGR